ncbi:MAG: bifunctional riboflavin kinase/FAD synthetase [Hydrogenophilales bacterium CG03_land_8_20_14_0_80_62_28]|nr:bifunctional riboflavin kinase/FAD synthetase [Betaproteobacteria bacterium]OIO77224.1 MAG: riboflavin biosynthesis protein RibF [Hydrogenophilaceae bacterium CG1_02_62_390]PIV22976.1 MAG: bifunctional riboflavin kinase/FAD synthetase [Hydrogenophilales bacterium CG03_land_8_20_14_0_80_62_28]PIW37615.1 MAG: bifunctional riboflavin kinase/FAD synthetase [Hydrogenophilales bacterium CG15_BIG_FIL_POST_REV_8_21_14_020_62_31]PIW72574.1 MAG: bifunctional riboflavin kinase/FAD synthetase [Hydrogeno
MLITHGWPHATRPNAVTIGNFDGVHLGHQAMLARLTARATSVGGLPTVLTFEPHPREIFTPHAAPSRLTSLREKLEILKALGVGHVHVCRFTKEFAALSAEDFVRRILVDGLKARYVLVGDDFRFGAKRAGNLALLQTLGERYGFQVDVLHTIEAAGQRASSTAVRTALAAGDMAGAAQLLGRPYSISGRVVGGDRIGRKIGYPTANILLKHNRPPVKGVFAVRVQGLARPDWPGVANLGTRPSVHPNGNPTLEVHLFDLDLDSNLYGQHLRVEFLHKLRDEQKFPSFDALVVQIGKDAALARELLNA